MYKSKEQKLVLTLVTKENKSYLYQRLDWLNVEIDWIGISNVKFKAREREKIKERK